MEVKEILRYIGQVADGKEKVSTYWMLQCQRHLNDILRLKEMDWAFDKEDAQKHVNFLTKAVRHSQDRWAGMLFQAQPFQLAMTAMLFGWKCRSEDTGDMVRKHTMMLYDIARKNGKTETAAALACDFLILTGHGTEIFTAATKREQAMKTFRSIAGQLMFMQKHSAKIRRSVRVLKYSIEIPAKQSLIMPLSSDYDKLDSHNPYLAIIDEYHAHRTSGVFNVMRSGQGARWDGPLLAATTTAGFDTSVPCFEFRKTSIEVLKGIKTDDSLLPIIFALDEEECEGDNWQNPELWYKSNPNLGVSVSTNFLKGELQKAINEGPTQQRHFQVKNVNMWVDQEYAWLERSIWNKKAAMHGKKYDILMGKRCYGGLDLSAVRDLTCLSLVFPVQPGLDRIYVICYHFMPMKRAKEMQRLGFKHMEWIQEEWISATSKDAVDYEPVITTIDKCARDFEIRELAFDRWGMQHVLEPIKNRGIEIFDHGQGYQSMNEPSKAFERDIYTKETGIEHFNNPVLAWQIGNVVTSEDPAGNIKPDKAKSNNQIDGIVATIMAWGRMKTQEADISPYETRDLRAF